MRVAFLLVLLALLGAAGFLAYQREHESTAIGTTPAAAPRALTPAQKHDCADVCEQTAILEQRPDDWLRACRAHCTGQAAKRPYTPIRSITVAPADHHR